MIAVDNRTMREDELVNQRIDWLIEHCENFPKLVVVFENCGFDVYTHDNPKVCNKENYLFFGQEYDDWAKIFQDLLTFKYRVF